MDLYPTIFELRRGLAQGTYSSTELTRSYLARIKSANDELNAFITICEESALAQAAAADEAIAGGSAGPLSGIPLAHKDIYCSKDILTSCASRILENFIAPKAKKLLQKHFSEDFGAAPHIT